MPAYVWAILATILQSRLAYGILKAIYTCPEKAIENKRCVWVTTREFQGLVKKENKDQRASAEDFLLSVAALFCEGGTTHTRAIAEASVDSGTKGFETLAKAKRTAAQMSTDIYSQTSIMVGRYMCSKPQDADFGSDTCDNLGDIAARLRRLVGGKFPSLGDLDWPGTLVLPRVRVALSAPCPSVAHPKKGASAGPAERASAGAAPEMPTMSLIDTDGARVGVRDRLNKKGMELGCKVVHTSFKGVYELEKTTEENAQVNVSLKLVHKCITMEQLWSKHKAEEDKAIKDKAPEAKGDPQLALGKVQALAATRSKASASIPPATLASTSPSALAADAEGASAGAKTCEPALAEGNPAVPTPKEFELQKVVELEKFLGEWSTDLPGDLQANRLHEYAFNPEWPEGRLTTNGKYGTQIAQGLVFSALALLGCQIDKSISPGRVLIQVLTPALESGFYCQVGHRAQGTNREC